VQERPGIVDRQVEALNEHASGVEGSIVTALAGDGGRDLGQVGCRSGKPFVARGRFVAVAIGLASTLFPLFFLTA